MVKKATLSPDHTGRIIKIRGDLAKLNEHDSANRANKFGGAALKNRMTTLVAEQVVHEIPIDYPIELGFTWHYSSRHDFDNIRFAAKYVLDGLVKASILPNDNQAWVKGFLYDKFEKVEKGNEGVTIFIKAYEQMER